VKQSYKRHFIAYQNEHKQQNFRLELSKIHKPDIGPIIRQIIDWSKGEPPGKYYDNYSDIYPNLGKWRIGDYRIYTYHLGGNVYTMLHVYKKLGTELPQSVKEKIVNRAIIYEDNRKARDLAKYAKAIRESVQL
jgi:hypothetical protein